MRRIVANLDVEEAWAHPGGTAPTMPAAVRRSMAEAGSLLRVLAEDGDRLWLPARLEPERLVEVPGLPQVTLEFAPLAKLPQAMATNTWGVAAGSSAAASDLASTMSQPSAAPATSTAVTDATVTDAAVTDAAVTDATVTSAALPQMTPPELLAAMWRQDPGNPQLAAQVNDRRLSLGLQQQLGCELPGSRVLAALPQLQEHLDGSDQPWVLKAPMSAAGRHRYIHRKAGEPLPTSRLEAMFRRHGELVFEPWMNRRDDFGHLLWIDSQQVYTCGSHRQLVDDAGRFRGIELAVDLGLSLPHLKAIQNTAAQVGMTLQRMGYRGPVGIDAWTYLDADGALLCQPLGEINARLTFGFVARLLHHRLQAAGTWPETPTTRLCFGSRQVHEQAREAGDRLLTLLDPGSSGGAIWLTNACKAGST